MAEKKIKFIELADLLEKELSLLPADAPAITLNELIDRFGVSRGTAKRTLLELQQRGILYSRVGAGSFVSPPLRNKLVIVIFELNHALAQQDTFNQDFLVRALIRCNMQHPNYTVSAMDFSDFVRDVDRLETLYPRLKGVVLLRNITPYLELTARLRKRGIACAFYGSSTHGDGLGDLDYLLYDEDEVISIALTALYERGCRMPGFAGNLAYPVYQERLKHFRKHVARMGMHYSPRIVLDTQTTDLCDKKILRRYLCELDAVVASDDRVALQLAHQATELGFRIPQELAIVGINNAPFLDWVYPGISSVAINTENDAEIVIDRLIRRIESGEPFQGNTTLKLVKRATI